MKKLHEDSMAQRLILANFGGPRNLEEIETFLKSLLNDQEIIRSGFPPFLHRFLFNRVAKKRAPKVAPDYEEIGGKSPIFEDTETIAAFLRKSFGCPVSTFHRYLEDTHKSFIDEIEGCQEEKIIVFPFFPQFSYATTGSIALFFAEHFSSKVQAKLLWIRSFAEDPFYIANFQKIIRETLENHHIAEADAAILFSAHGIPKKFAATGDPYVKECEATYKAVAAAFPEAATLLSYQSQFGKEEWIRPYTKKVCEDPFSWNQGRTRIFIAPLSFPTDHIETLFEIEKLYIRQLREKGLEAWRIPALNLRENWLNALPDVITRSRLYPIDALLRDYAFRKTALRT